MKLGTIFACRGKVSLISWGLFAVITSWDATIEMDHLGGSDMAGNVHYVKRVSK